MDPLNNGESRSDDEDLFVSTYEHSTPAITVAEITKNSNETDQPISAEEQKNDSGNIESQMNTIDLNDDSESIDLKRSASETKPQPSPLSVNESQLPKSFISNIPSPLIEMSQTNNKEVSINSSQIQISVSDPHKIGEGIGSYMVYTINTKTSLPYFRRQSLSVNRRFSDFLGLHEKLMMKHAQTGRIIPPPPSKSAMGTAKIKMAKDEAALVGSDFLSKRKAALERYLLRNAEHPVICADPDFREFLELDHELPRSTSTSALSGANVKRLFSFVGDTVSKMTFRMEESDPWFESKQYQIDSLDSQFRKLYAAIESLIHHRKELTVATGQLAKSAAILGNCEEHNSLSCALSQLASTQEMIEKIYERQSNNDFLYLAELLKDYIHLIGAVRETFQERVKCFQNLSYLENQLNKKREQKTKFELSMKNDKLPQLDEEIGDLQDKVEKAKNDFELISTNIKQEFDRFEMNRIKDFKCNFLKYMKSLLETQESFVECWEGFLPEAKSIVV